MKRFLIHAAAASWALTGAATHAAEPAVFPAKTVRWIVPYPPGGSIDVVGRVLAARLSGGWAQQIIIDNRTGAGGRIGVQAAIAAPADGYTQLLTLNTNYTIDRSLFRNIGYDPEKALAPVTIAASTAQLLITNTAFPPKTVKELVALAKARPNEINYGSSGAGGSLHLAIELFKSMAGIQMVHVPYKGGPPAATDLIAGQIQVMFFNAPAAAPYIKAGKVRALGISTLKRSPQLPEIPTIHESGVPGFNVDVWFGLSVPSGTPAAIIAKTHQDIAKALEETDVRKQFANLGADPLSVTPDEMARRIRTETATWAKVIQNSSIKFE